MAGMRAWVGVVLLGLVACTTPAAEKDLPSQLAARAEGKIRSAFEPRLSLVRDLASRIESLCAMPSANEPLQLVLEDALKINRDFFGLNIVLEPEGISACGREAMRSDPGFDGRDDYSAYYFWAGDKVDAQAEDRDPQILAGWYEPLIDSPGAHLQGPTLYPLAGMDTAVIGAASTLQIGGRSIGAISLDSAYEDLIAELNFPEFKSGRGGAYLIDDSDRWLIAPFHTDIGLGVADRRTGGAESGLVKAYATYRQSHDGQAWTATADGLTMRFSPLRLAGQDRDWTLVVVLQKDVVARS